MFRSTLRILAVVGACVVYGASAAPPSACAQSTCPLSYLSFGAYGIPPFTVFYQDAVRETSFTIGNQFTWQAYCQAGYDLVRGQVRAGSAQVGYAVAIAGANDEYVATGLAPGAPFTIRARLNLNAVITRRCTPHGHCDDAVVQATLREGLANEATVQVVGSIETSIYVTIQGTAGFAFPIFASVRTEATADEGLGSDGSASAFLDFVDLPAGVRITSCQGYVQDAPVAISRSSWGRLKQSYR